MKLATTLVLVSLFASTAAFAAEPAADASKPAAHSSHKKSHSTKHSAAPAAKASAAN
ncbi:hypothetical protein [Niveibacterium sp. SC-1]|uniref:hypothetical protein n=1 Tax=Niveibacterium sp. SC-1 TaxID=3135646 RepID=UPI0031202EF5